MIVAHRFIGGIRVNEQN